MCLKIPNRRAALRRLSLCGVCNSHLAIGERFHSAMIMVRAHEVPIRAPSCGPRGPVECSKNVALLLNHPPKRKPPKRKSVEIFNLLWFLVSSFQFPVSSFQFSISSFEFPVSL